MGRFGNVINTSINTLPHALLKDVGPQEPSILPLDVWGIRTRGRAVVRGDSGVF